MIYFNYFFFLRNKQKQIYIEDRFLNVTNTSYQTSWKWKFVESRLLVLGCWKLLLLCALQLDCSSSRAYSRKVTAINYAENSHKSTNTFNLFEYIKEVFCSLLFIYVYCWHPFLMITVPTSHSDVCVCVCVKPK